MGKRYKNAFAEEENQVSNNQMKRCSTLLITRDMFLSACRVLGTGHFQTWLVMVEVSIGTAVEGNLAIFISKVHFVQYTHQKYLHMYRRQIIAEFVIEKYSQRHEPDNLFFFPPEALGPLRSSFRINSLRLQD